MEIGKTKEGEAIQAFSLVSPELEVSIANYGARLLTFVYRGVDLLYGPKTGQELLADACYCGSICGRVANRIAGASFSLGENTYTLAANNGPNHLHGGTRGFSDRIWQVEEHTPSRLVLSLTSPDGEEGYPGAVHVTATYELRGNSLSLDLDGSTDAWTVLNLTNHAYWNLKGSGTVDDHFLQVNASAYTPMVGNIPTGVIMPVQGTLYDLRVPVRLGERNAPEALAGGYDDNYVLPALSPAIFELREAARLSCRGITLQVATDAPGLQVYTGDYLPLPRGGVALEAQSFPDSPHHPHFPSIELEPSALYRRHIEWAVFQDPSNA